MATEVATLAPRSEPIAWGFEHRYDPRRLRTALIDGAPNRKSRLNP
jgi:hypothetical protein